MDELELFLRENAHLSTISCKAKCDMFLLNDHLESFSGHDRTEKARELVLNNILCGCAATRVSVKVQMKGMRAIAQESNTSSSPSSP